MSPNSFDREIKAKLFAAETDVSDHLWSAVAHNLAPQRKKRWFLWLLLPCALGLGSGAVILLHPGEVNSKNVASLISDSGPTSYPAIVTGKDHGSRASEKSANSEQATSSDVSLVINEVRSGGNQILSKGTKNKVPLDIANNKMASLLTTNQHLIALEDHKIPVDLRPGQNTERGISDPVTKTALTLLEPIRTMTSPFFESADPNLKICPSFAAPSHFKPFLELGFSAGLPFRTLEERSQEMMGYKQNREQTEKVRSSLALQALVGVEINSQFEVKAGIGLTKIYEVFDYVDETATRTTTSTTVDTIRDLAGNIVAIRIDTSVTTEYGQRIKLSQNRYTFLNVPVLAAYKFKVRDHQFFVQGGAIINLALKTRGDIRSPEDKIQSIDTDNSETTAIFRKNSGIELTGSVGYELEMSERTSLRFSATYRHALEDMTLADYPLGQRYKHIHLGVSLKHNLK